jgi:hypothetical protein
LLLLPSLLLMRMHTKITCCRVPAACDQRMNMDEQKKRSLSMDGTGSVRNAEWYTNKSNQHITP